PRGERVPPAAQRSPRRGDTVVRLDRDVGARQRGDRVRGATQPCRAPLASLGLDHPHGRGGRNADLRAPLVRVRHVGLLDAEPLGVDHREDRPHARQMSTVKGAICCLLKYAIKLMSRSELSATQTETFARSAAWVTLLPPGTRNPWPS